MPNKSGLCENCGGKLEVAYNWRKLMVCGPCFRELSVPPAAASESGKPEPLLPLAAVVLVIAVTVVGGIVLARRWHRPSAVSAPLPGAASQSSDAGQVPAGLSPEEKAQFALLMAHPRPTQRTSVPASAPSAGSLAGVVRFARAGRDPEPQPRLRVQLLRTTVRRQAVQSSLTAEGQGWRELADAYAGDNTDSGATPSGQNAPAVGAGAVGNSPSADTAQGSTATSSDSTQTDDQQFTQQTAAGIARIQSAMQAVPSEADTAAALTMLADVAVFNVPNFDDCVADATFKETRTDDEGRYAFNEIPPGDYYLHAVRIGERAFTEWCVPVHVEDDGQAVHTDLTNANAAVLQTNR